MSHFWLSLENPKCRALLLKRHKLRFSSSCCASRASMRKLLGICTLIGLALSGPLGAQAPPSATGGSGAIRGRILAENGRGVPQAAVYLRRAGDAPDAMRWTNSDTEGNFHFDSLAEGAFHLTASFPGYVMAEETLSGKTESLLYYPGDFASLSIVKGGVITGLVTDAAGNPAVSAHVEARPLERGPREFPPRSFPFNTDDRGVFRIYGLHSGNYYVSAGGSSNNYMFSAYDGIAPSFYSAEAEGIPSRLEVKTGLEISGIDIRLRGDFGHSIRGVVAIAPSLKSATMWAEIHLIHAETGILEKIASTSQEFNAWKFTLSHVPDGNYFLLALTGWASEPPGASDPFPLSVRAQDVGNVKLVLNPLGTLTGRVVVQPLETGADCPVFNPRGMKALVLSTLRLTERKERVILDSYFPAKAETVVDAKGNFQLAGLSAGNHFLRVHLPSPALYLKSILPSAIPATGAKAAASKLIFPIRSGQAGDPIQITLAQGAAEISGKLTASEGKTGESGSFRIFLVPVEQEAADNILRYAETRSDGDGKFVLRNLVPGTYWLLTWPEANHPGSARELPSYFSAPFRQKLRQAVAQEPSITLKPCQSLANVVLRIP